jgi:hypothetical protein
VAGGPPCWPRISEVWSHSRPIEPCVHAELRVEKRCDITELRAIKRRIRSAKMRPVELRIPA